VPRGRRPISCRTARRWRRRRVGEGGITYTAIAAPVRGVAPPASESRRARPRGELRLRQDRRKVLGDERNLGIGFDRVGAVGIVGGRGAAAPTSVQHALGIERRDLGAEIAGCHRQIAGDTDERPHPHDVAIADAGDRGDPLHNARGGRFAGRRQTIALVQAGGASLGAECAAQPRPSTRSGTLANVISPVE